MISNDILLHAKVGSKLIYTETGMLGEIAEIDSAKEHMILNWHGAELAEQIVPFFYFEKDECPSSWDHVWIYDTDNELLLIKLKHQHA